VTWASSNTTVAPITAGGLATAATLGTSTITASLASISGTTTLTVVNAVLQMLMIDPNAPMLPAGETVQFTATGTYSDGSTQDLTTQVTWGATPASVATISNSPGTQGLATAVAMGMSTISAQLGNVSTMAMLMVTAAELKSITVTPSNPSIAPGATQQFIASGTFSDGTTQDLSSQVTWASATISVATINTAGLATAAGTGTSTISASDNGITGSTVLTVTTVPAATISGLVFDDLNGNGSQDQGETGVNGWVVQLLSGATVVGTATTGLDGSFKIANVAPGTYTLAQVLQSDYIQTSPAPPGTLSVTVAAGDNISGETFGVHFAPVLSPVAVRDNSQAGYYHYGVWTVNAGGFDGTNAVANPTTSSTASARWTLDVPSGTYDLWTTWVGGGSNATNAPYSIYDGFTHLSNVAVNQRVAPIDGQYGGMLWRDLGTFMVTNGRVTVALSASGADGNIVADGVLLVPAVTLNAAIAPPSPPATPSASPSSSPGSVVSSTFVPVMSPPTTGPAQAGSSGAVSIQISAPPVVSSSTVTLAVNYSTDSSEPSHTAGAHRAARKTAASTHRAIKRPKSHQVFRESLIARLAREQIASRIHTGYHQKTK
jgi:hypothetical protein